MRTLAALVVGSLFAPVAHAESIAVSLLVRQITHVRSTPHAFSGVGAFQIFRGNAVMAGSQCPEASDDEGRLSCVIVCDKTDALVKQLRIVPPSPSVAPRVKGYIAPASAAFQLKGCSISPVDLPPLVFRDAQTAFADLLKKHPEFSRIVKEGAPSAAKLVAVDEGLPILKPKVNTPEGRASLATLDEIARAFSGSNSNATMAEQYTKYSVGIHNIFLGYALESKARIDVPSDFKITGEKGDFYKNLGLVERSLDRKPVRTAQENLLLNDIQRAKHQPIGSIGKSRLYRLEGG